MSKKFNSLICLVETCLYNDGEGGCISSVGHTIISPKGEEAVCCCYEVKEEKTIRLVVDNKK